jgi:hypothetical protein
MQLITYSSFWVYTYTYMLVIPTNPLYVNSGYIVWFMSHDEIFTCHMCFGLHTHFANLCVSCIKQRDRSVALSGHGLSQFILVYFIDFPTPQRGLPPSCDSSAIIHFYTPPRGDVGYRQKRLMSKLLSSRYNAVVHPCLYQGVMGNLNLNQKLSSEVIYLWIRHLIQSVHNVIQIHKQLILPSMTSAVSF